MSCVLRRSLVGAVVSGTACLAWVETTDAGECLQQKLTASDAVAGQQFGFSVAIDGDYAVVGAAGVAYVFHREGNLWVQQAKLDNTGPSAAISGDRIAIGNLGDDEAAMNAGAVFVFRRVGTSWIQEAKLIASDASANDHLGRRVDIAGDIIVVGAIGDDDAALDAGSVYVFRWNGTAWMEEQELFASDAQANDFFGLSVATDGSTILVGTNQAVSRTTPAQVYVFRWNGVSWIEEERLTGSDPGPGDQFGASVNVLGDLIVVGTPAAWGDEDPPRPGSAYVFRFDGASWTEEAKLQACDFLPGDLVDTFGAAVAVRPDVLVVGGSQAREAGTIFAGSAYVYKHSSGTWIEELRLTRADPESNDFFGSSLALSGDDVIVGAVWDDDACPQDQFCNSGSAYMFSIRRCLEPAIPTISSWGFFVLMGLMVTAGTIIIRHARSRMARLMIVLGICANWGSVSVQAQPSAPPELFTEATGFTDPWSAGNPLVIRSRAVYVDLALLNALNPQDTLTFNLFSATSYVGVFEERITRRSDSYTWFGSLVGEPGSRFVLTVEQNVCLASIDVSGSEVHRVAYLGDGVHVVRELDVTLFPPCDTPAGGSQPPGGGSGSSSVSGCVDDGSTIDLMVLYTPAARVEQGGYTAIKALINQAEDLTNQAYANSQINTRANVIMTFEVNYVEASPSNAQKDIDCLILATCEGCGFGTGCTGDQLKQVQAMQQVHALRDEVRADVVSMLTGNVSYGGRAGFENEHFSIQGEDVGGQWVVSSFPQLAFNVVNSGLADELTFPHELAHNYGCRHQRANDPSDGAFPYSHGYIDAANGFGTIMAQGGTTRIGHFSNPNVFWLGCPTGNPLDCPTGVPVGQPGEAHNALSINNVDTLVANFRASDCNNNGLCDAQDIAAGTSLDCNGNNLPDECELSVHDCNANGIPDDCDILNCPPGNLTCADCNDNGVPDACENPADCNDNGVLDVCDLFNGTSLDCNSNGVPDECDLASGTSTDCNNNGFPDECDDPIPTGVCCPGNGTCQEVPQSQCPSAKFFGCGTTCPDRFPLPKACCLPPDGCCINSDPTWCNQMGGFFRSTWTCGAIPNELLCPPIRSPSPSP